MPRKVRDYRDEYDSYHSKPENLKRHAARNKARRDYERKNGDLPSSIDLDHKKPLSKGGSTKLSNVRPMSQAKNRSFARTATGAMKTPARQRGSK
jgi:5-methylcytosine-specific restriction endonuclease McrA